MPKFNDAQKEAITTIRGPVLCVAGPGSGKTTAMVHRVRYMIEHEHIPAENILVITFTKASALQMQERFEKQIEQKSFPVTFGTFHSVFFSILRRAYGYRGSDVLSEEEKFGLLRQILQSMELEYDDEEDMIVSLIQEIGKMKGDMIPIEYFYSAMMGAEEFRKIYYELEKRVTGAGKLDYDDMLVYCYELLKEREDIRSFYQKKYQYILVDEFQDINKIQYEIVKMLAAPSNHLFIVGDDDQSIYGFRGSRPEIMLHFEEDYPNAKKIILDVNYRCNRNITEGALRVISHNKIRFGKKIVSHKGYEEPIHVHHVKTLKEEYSHVLDQIHQYKNKGIEYSNIAIITRTNMQSRGMVNHLISYNIPFRVRDRIPCIYDHFAVKTIFDYILAAQGVRSRELFLRIINKPKRYISREMMTDEVFHFEKIKQRCRNRDWIADRLTQLEYDLSVLAKLKPYAAVNFIRKAIGYDSYLEEYASFRHISVDDIYQTLDELQEIAKQYHSFDEWMDGIKVYRQELEHITKKNDNNQKEGITITTMHSAKGLEYDVVFILEANESLTPYKKAKKPEEIEEERRMFYVAMTRARNYLHIYDVKEYYNKELEPSRFLEEILQ